MYTPIVNTRAPERNSVQQRTSTDIKDSPADQIGVDPSLLEVFPAPLTEHSLVQAAAEQQNDELANALTVVNGLPEALKSDSGAAFGKPVLIALALVKYKDPAAYARAKAVLQKAKVSTRDVEREVARLAGLDAQKLQLVSSSTKQEPRTAGELLEGDCPAPDLIVPAGFSLRLDAMARMVPRTGRNGELTYVEEVFAHAPVVIAARLHDVEDGSESLDLRYRRADGWHQIIADRAVALDSSKIMQLASRGFPVASTAAKELVGYLHDLEGLNFHRIPATPSTSHLGWQERDGDLEFLCGRTVVLAEGGIARSHGPEDVPGSPILFVGRAAGDEQIADSLYPRGSMDGWLSAISQIAEFPRVVLGLFVSLVAPLLMILGAPNAVVDWWNRTSTGKTTVLRVAASVWGNPDEQTFDSFIGSWDSTAVFIERASSVLTGLPLLLDETKRAKDQKVVGKVLYEVAEGRGRSRGNVKSISRTTAWRTVLLSTGETPATSFTQDGGTQARVLEIHGQPFGRADEETGKLVRKLNLDLKANFGHAGPVFVQWLMKHKSRWEKLEQSYLAAIADYAARVPEGNSRIDRAVVDRLAHTAGAIQIAADCAHHALDLPWLIHDPLETIWPEIVADTGGATGDERALSEVLSWAYSRQESFWGREEYTGGENSSVRVPNMGWSGKWDKDDDWEFIAFYPHVLKKVLVDFRYEPEAILAGWKERGWLQIGKGRKFDKSVRADKGNPFMIVISRVAIDAIESDN